MVRELLNKTGTIWKLVWQREKWYGNFIPMRALARKRRTQFFSIGLISHSASIALSSWLHVGFRNFFLYYVGIYHIMMEKINLGKFRHISGAGGLFSVFDRFYNSIFRIKSYLGFISVAYALVIRLWSFWHRRIRIWWLKSDPNIFSACSRTSRKLDLPETANFEFFMGKI